MNGPDLEKFVRYWVWYYWPGHDEAMEPGGFYRKLMPAVVHADPTNLAKIGRGFPQFVKAKRLVDLSDDVGDLVWTFQDNGL